MSGPVLQPRVGRYLVGGYGNDADYGLIYSYDGHLWVAWLGCAQDQRTELGQVGAHDAIYRSRDHARAEYLARLGQRAEVQQVPSAALPVSAAERGCGPGAERSTAVAAGLHGEGRAMVTQLTREQAIALSDSKWWEGKSAREVAAMQLAQRLLCMPFDVFHRNVEEALGRSVWTHEFARFDLLLMELQGERRAPSMSDIVAMLPAEKTIVGFTRESARGREP